MGKLLRRLVAQNVAVSAATLSVGGLLLAGPHGAPGELERMKGLTRPEDSLAVAPLLSASHARALLPVSLGR